MNRQIKGGSWGLVRLNVPGIEGGSPEPLSIHWSTPWPMDKKICEAYNKRWITNKDPGDLILSVMHFGEEHDPSKARKVIFGGHMVRLFEEEIGLMDDERLRIYIEEGWTLQEEDVAGNPVHRFTEDMKFLFDAARLDGCDDHQAYLVAKGFDPADNLPPVGWYKAPDEVKEWLL